MANKKLLALLMAVSMAFQQAVIADDVVTPTPSITPVENTVTPSQDVVTTDKDDAQTTVASTTAEPAVETDNASTNDESSDSAAPTLSANNVLALRCILFLVAKNALRALMKSAYDNSSKKSSYLELGTLSADNYLGHLVTYGIDVAAPYKNKDEVTGGMKAIEFLAKEINVVGDKKEAFSWQSSQDSVVSVKPWVKMFFKALNRNKLFILPESAKTVLKNDIVSMTTAMLEGLSYDASKADWSTSIDRKGCADAFIYGQVAMRSGNLAKDLIALALMQDKVPAGIVKLMETEEGMALVENIVAQVIEDSVKQIYKSTALHG